MKKDWVLQFNDLGRQRKPFFFVINYATTHAEIYLIDELEDYDISFQFPSIQSKVLSKSVKKPICFSKEQVDFEIYKEAYDKVLFHLERGDSYLTNLTLATPIHINIGLNQLYPLIQAKYKIKFRQDWVCFSPETFIQIQNNRVSTFPMKGTIDATIPNAIEVLRNDLKEKAEHSTIVDLLRNDLSMVAKNVHIQRLMFLDKVHTNQGDILQMSSEIMGDLQEDWHADLGSILKKLLPAGSICGAPKQKTLEIIAEAENYDRGYYTGIAGCYDGNSLDTCVLIRFIEQTPKGLVYKSGGGITALSEVEKEYNELNQKIYVPIS